MGVVWSAYDRTLDRNVALKVLHDRYLGAADQERLANEARAMARLSHPNVVAVYDVGERDGRTFVTMELVRGQAISTWLETPRSWREVLDVFRAAGEGLAAAHEAGIVHRDVKPSNILLGDDGRARVADFGVAHASGPLTGAATTTTVTAGVIGSPAYMSPERLAGEPADARGDQFAFCVALFEALHGRRPFHADTVDGLRGAIAQGPPPPIRDAPRWLHAVIVRGLSPDPAARFASMRELLDAMRGPKRRRYLVAALGGGAAVAVATSLALGPGAAGPTCEGGARHLAGIWDTAVAAKVATALEASGVEFAAATARETLRVLDRYAGEWVAMHEAACRATHVDHTQSRETLERRQLCLDRRRHGLQRTIEILREGNAPIDKAPMLARSLEPIADCADPAHLAGLTAAPSSLADDLALARIHLFSGRYEEGGPVADAVVAAASARGDRALAAAALMLRGRLESFTKDRARSIDSLRAAAELAAAIDAPRLRAEALIHLSGVLQTLGRLPEAGEVLDVADALLAGAPDPLLAAHAASVRGTLLGRQTRYADAVPHFERALSGFAAVYGPESEALVPSLNNLALALRRAGRPAPALLHLRRARALSEALGESHPVALKARRDLAIAIAETGALTEAEAELRTVLALQQRRHPGGHLDVALAWSDLGNTLSKLGRDEEALQAFREAVAIRVELAPHARETLTARADVADTLTGLGRAVEAEPLLREVLAARQATLGAVHGDVALGQRQLASALSLLGRFDEATRAYEAARAIYVELHGDGHPQVASTLRDQAVVERQRRRFRAALDLDRRALAIRERVFPAGHPERVQSLLAVALDLEELGRHASAHAHAERAVRESSGEDYHAANARWALAQMLDAHRQEATRAVELARDARRRFAGMSGRAARTSLQQVDAWLAERTRAPRPARP